MMEVGGEPQGEGILPAVRSAGVVVGGQDDDEGPDFPVLDGVVHDMLEGVGVLRGAHDGGLVAPAAVAEVENVVRLFLGVAVGEIDPGRLGQPVGMILVGEGLPGLVGQFLQLPLLGGGSGVALRDVLQFLRNRAAEACFPSLTKEPAHNLLVRREQIPAAMFVAHPLGGEIGPVLDIQDQQPGDFLL